MTASHSLVRHAKAFAKLLRAGFFAFLPAAAVAGGLALAPLIGAAGAAGARFSHLRNAFAKPRPALWLLLAFAGWAALSSFWSSYRDHGQALRLLLTLIPGLIFIASASADSEARRLTQAGGAAALSVLMALLAVEAFAGMPLNRAVQPEALDWVLMRNPGRGASVLVVLIWGVLGALLTRGGRVRFALAGAIAILGAVIAAQFGMDANIAAYAIGAFAFAAGYAAPRAGLVAVTCALALWLLTAPLAAPLLFANAPLAEALPTSWAMRIEIWRFASERILEQPWIGHGLDASRSFDQTLSVRGEQSHALPLHPHSFSLQVWLETGAVGAGLAAAALIAGGVTLARAFAANRAAAAAACASLAAAGFIANISYGAWQEWWIATMLTAAALVAAIGVTSAKASRLEASERGRDSLLHP